MKQLREKFLRNIFESTNSSECAARGHSVKKNRQNFPMNTGVDKLVGYELEVLDEYFAYGNTKLLYLSEKPVFTHVLMFMK